MTSVPRALRITLWAVIWLQAVLLVARLVLELRLVGSSSPPQGGIVAVAVDVLTMAVFPAVGLVIIRRRPGHPVGWLFCVANLGWIVNSAVQAYVRLGVVAEPGSVPAPETIVWPYTWAGFVSSAFYVLLVLLFPNGRFLSRRWRALGRTTVAAMAVAAVLAALAPGPVDPSLGVDLANPLGLSGGAAGRLVYEVSTLGYPAAMLLLLAAVVSAVQRYRRSGGVERLQLKWFASGIAAWGTLLGAYLAVTLRYPDWDFPLWARALELAAHLGAGIVPLAAGIAILRYRLYEIDRLVSRTVTYALLTAILIGVYVTGVVGLGSLIRSVPGTDPGDLLVAASTLAVAALFRPARRHIQAVVDRRFNRARYDAQKTVEALTQRLRDEVNLDLLGTELTRAVGDALQPCTIRLWLR